MEDRFAWQPYVVAPGSARNRYLHFAPPTSGPARARAWRQTRASVGLEFRMFLGNRPSARLNWRRRQNFTKGGEENKDRSAVCPSQQLRTRGPLSFLFRRWPLSVSQRVCAPRAERDVINGVLRMERVRPMEKPKRPYPTDKQGGEQPLSFDPMTPPAPVDVHGFSRRAGEIIARAARTLLSLSRGKSARKTPPNGRDAY